MDNLVLESIFSNCDTLASLPSYHEHISKQTKDKIDLVFDYMARINPVEADMLELHLIKGIPQSVIGLIFGYTQPNVHYRITRALERLKVVFQIPFFTEEEIETKLKGFFSNPKDVLVLKLVYLYSSQSLVAREIGESQGKVRYRFLKCLKAMKNIPELGEVYGALSTINENITLLRRSKNVSDLKRVII
jgi:hypothetical protein